MHISKEWAFFSKANRSFILVDKNRLWIRSSVLNMHFADTAKVTSTLEFSLI